jgi:S-methylmethionine-dependent homocysteine/selenocysteine methylase
MAKYRNHLPQLDGGFYLADGGLETTLIFQEGWELPDFAAFILFETPQGEAALRKYFRSYAEIAKRYCSGLVLESPTWRASTDWGVRLGYKPEALAAANHKAIRLLQDIRGEYETEQTPVVISGCLGPRGDGYVVDHAMSEQEAQDYHRQQIDTFADTAADMVCATTMNCTQEAVGIVRAAQAAALPAAVSFTVETDGRLPNGQTLRAAIEEVDQATSAYPCYYMINCAHPTHFEHVLAGGGLWSDRIRGVRANASHKSHAELDESAELDSGNPVELGAQYARLKKQLAHLNVMGGCCGTDHRHVEQIAVACSPIKAQAYPYPSRRG